MADEHGEKTEKPSAKKLRDARKKGQVPRSTDLVAALSLLAVTFVLGRTGVMALARLKSRAVEALYGLSSFGHQNVTPDAVGVQVAADGILLAAIVAPVMITAAAVGIAVNVLQSGWVFAPERLAPDWSRLSPKTGLRRLKPLEGGMALLKAVVAVTVLASLAWPIVQENLADTPRLAWMSTETVSFASGAALRRLLLRGGSALLLLALADVGLQWYKHYTSLKMTRQDQRDEAKTVETNPEVKARVRRIQRDMVRKRMLSAVPSATVVITNPSHFAVALSYQRGTMAAPVVVAKGRDFLAQKIKQIARDHGVPTVENMPLAQALYKGADVGDSIPADLFGAVAEVLAYLVRIRQLML